jgi:hypothetical protein
MSKEASFGMALISRGGTVRLKASSAGILCTLLDQPWVTGCMENCDDNH